MYFKAVTLCLALAALFAAFCDNLTGQALAARDTSRTDPPKAKHSLSFDDLPLGKIVGTVVPLKDNQFGFNLFWRFPGEVYIVNSIVDKDYSILMAKRTKFVNEKPVVEVFAKCPTVIEGMKSHKMTVKLKGAVNLSKPYIIQRRRSGEFLVKPYTETTELDRFFSTLDILLHNRALRLLAKQPELPIGLTDMELSDRLMFQSRVKSVSK